MEGSLPSPVAGCQKLDSVLGVQSYDESLG